ALSAFSRLNARRILAYHNITPPRFFLHYGLRHYYETAIGRLQLPQAVRAADQCWTESLYNKRELDMLRAADSQTVALLMQLHRLDGLEPDRAILERCADGRTNIVFVGRLIPNKRQDHLLSAFAQYRRNFNKKSRLLLVGRHDELRLYFDELRAHTRRL